MPKLGRRLALMSVVMSLFALLLAACSTNSSPTGTVEAKLEFAGGVPPGSPRPQPGTVTLRGTAGAYTIKVAKSGRFTIRVPLGGYTVTSHGPYFNDGHATCGGRSIHVTAGALVQAIAICYVQ